MFEVHLNPIFGDLNYLLYNYILTLHYIIINYYMHACILPNSYYEYQNIRIKIVSGKLYVI